MRKSRLHTKRRIIIAIWSNKRKFHLYHLSYNVLFVIKIKQHFGKPKRIFKKS